MPKSSLSYTSYHCSAGASDSEMYPQGCSSPLEFLWYSTAPVATLEASVSRINGWVGSGIRSAGFSENSDFNFSNALCRSGVHCQGVFIRVNSCSGLVMSEYFGMNLL